MNSTLKKENVSLIPLNREDYAGIIEANLQTLQTSYVLVNAKQNKVVVREDSVADVKFRDAEAGKVVPVGVVTREDVLYRLYLVSPELL